jgi:DNA-binding NarL/FixJ family response regulator
METLETKKDALKKRRKLSRRETEILSWIAMGKKNIFIAEKLDLNQKTVATYYARIKKNKLKIPLSTNTFGTIMAAVKQGYLPVSILNPEAYK